MDAYEYSFVKMKVRRLVGVDLDCYKSAQMQRHLQAFLRRSGHANWPALFRAIQDDPGQLGKFRDCLTINVSHFFRDLDRFEFLQGVVLPGLLHSHPRLRVWSAGCSHGHEPYSLAILLAEMTGVQRQHQILATDMDGSALEQAQAGGPYSADEVASLPSSLVDRYFHIRDGDYWVNDCLRRAIAFRQHNLLAEPFDPLGTQEIGYDLIVCRNVVIYFTPEAKEQLYRRFHGALRPGGVLFVGGTEVVCKASDMGFKTLGMCFYCRSGTAGSRGQ